MGSHVDPVDVCMCVQAPSPCALDRTAAWLLNMNSASSYGETEDDRHDDALIEKVRTGVGSVPVLVLTVCPALVLVQYQQEIALLQEKLRVAALRQDECEARLLIQDQQNQRMLQEYQVGHAPDHLVKGRWSHDSAGPIREDCVFQVRLEDTESRLRRLQDDKDLQMNSIISRSEPVCPLTCLSV